MKKYMNMAYLEYLNGRVIHYYNHTFIFSSLSIDAQNGGEVFSSKQKQR